jgi:transportin-3
MFAAQTIRAKVCHDQSCDRLGPKLTYQILYDFQQLPRESLPPLRDSILSTLAPLVAPGAPAGSKAVLLQLCLALADLALQMPEWNDVVGSMIEQFGKDAATVHILLGFLKALVEEVGNPRLMLGVCVLLRPDSRR